MNKTVISVLLIICVNNNVNAQTGTTPPAAIKKQTTTSSTTEKKSKSSSSSSVPIETNKKPPTQTNVNTVDKEKAAKASEMIKVDFNNMPANVQSKINDNKAKGKYLLEGIAKSFTVEIKSCITDADQVKTLSFLKAKKGFIQTQFVSAGVVKIIVEPELESADLKEAMAAEGIHFNFLNRSYLLKN